MDKNWQQHIKDLHEAQATALPDEDEIKILPLPENRNSFIYLQTVEKNNNGNKDAWISIYNYLQGW